jgi:hypothetical protein
MSCRRSLVLFAALLIVLACVIRADPAWAGTQDGSAIALHVKAHTSKGTTVCTTWAPTIPCSDYVTAWPVGTAADIYLVVTRAQWEPGIAGLSCGIDYAAAPGAGVDVSGYTLCADLEFTNAGANGEWPAAGGGNRITWNRLDNCQRTLMGNDGVHAVACAFYVYAYGEDQFRVIPNANLQSGPEIRVADCSSAESSVTTAASGTVFFSAAALGGCNPCTDTCDEGSACFVTPKFVDFGTVAPGESLEKSFTISNQSTIATSGAVADTCPSFEVVSGGGFYTLLPGASREVVVRFAPTGWDGSSCIISTGALCQGVRCTGNLGVQCELSPESISFGEVAVGEYVDRSFTITSTGSVPLQVGPTSPCSEFSILSGGGIGQLSPGQSRTVIVRFAPTTLGTRACSIYTGTGCESLPCTGIGVSRCQVTPTTLPFGSVLVGETRQSNFTITNKQVSHTLAVNVTATCTAFSIVAGGGYAVLLPGETRTVTVRFSPVARGGYSCEIRTGSADCGIVTCSGSAYLLCTVSPTELDFGTVPIGYFADRTFWITASGDGQSGEVTLTGGDFSILSGGGYYSLPRGDSRQVVVRFQPSTPGPQTCTIDTGNDDCGVVTGTGEGEVSTSYQNSAVITFHAKSHTMKAATVCVPAQSGGPAPTDIPCTDYVTSVGTGTNYDVYIMVARVNGEDGISGAAFGITYNGTMGAGVDVFDWISCSDNEQPGADWPNAGSGLAMSWSPIDDCQRTPIPEHPEEGVVAAVGALYVYAYGADRMDLTAREDVPTRNLSVTDCVGVITALPPDRVGSVSFSPSGAEPGYNPCNANVPVAVSMLSFTASRGADGAELRWRAAGIESDHAGFTVHRETATGERAPLDGAIAMEDGGYVFVDIDPPSAETRYWLAERSRAGDVTWFGPAVLSAGEPGGLGFKVLGVGPSPFTTSSRLTFRTSEPGPVTVRMLDALGREVARPQEGALPAGTHEVIWDGRAANGQAAPAGVYLYRIETPHGSASGKIVLIRRR